MFNEKQVELLLKKMVEAAKAVETDTEYRHSDYGGMEVFRFTSEESVAEFTKELNDV